MGDRDLQGPQFGRVKVWTRGKDSFLFLDCCCSAVLKIAEPELQSFRNFFFFSLEWRRWYEPLRCVCSNIPLFSGLQILQCFLCLFCDLLSELSKSSGGTLGRRCFPELKAHGPFETFLCLLQMQFAAGSEPHTLSFDPSKSPECAFVFPPIVIGWEKSHKKTFSVSDLSNKKQCLMESLIQDNTILLCSVYSRGYLGGIWRRFIQKWCSRLEFGKTRLCTECSLFRREASGASVAQMHWKAIVAVQRKLVSGQFDLLAFSNLVVIWSAVTDSVVRMQRLVNMWQMLFIHCVSIHWDIDSLQW